MSRTSEASSTFCSLGLPVEMRRVCKVGTGWCRCSAIRSRQGRESSTRTVRPTSREVWGAMNSASSGEERLMTMGIDPDRSIYA